MRVIQLIGRLAGQEIDLPVREAEACLANGTVARIGSAIRMKGFQPAPNENVAGDAAPLSVDALLAMAEKGSDTPFLKFKSEAAKLLGEPITAKKTEIVERLIALRDKSE